MSNGIYGSSSIDRHNQRSLDSYLDSIDPSLHGRYCRVCDQVVPYERVCDDCPEGDEN